MSNLHNNHHQEPDHRLDSPACGHGGRPHRCRQAAPQLRRLAPWRKQSITITNQADFFYWRFDRLLFSLVTSYILKFYIYICLSFVYVFDSCALSQPAATWAEPVSPRWAWPQCTSPPATATPPSLQSLSSKGCPSGTSAERPAWRWARWPIRKHKIWLNYRSSRHLTSIGPSYS